MSDLERWYWLNHSWLAGDSTPAARRGENLLRENLLRDEGVSEAPAACPGLEDSAHPGANLLRDAGAAEASARAKTGKTRRRASREQLRSRLGRVRQWLIDGRSSRRIVRACQERFGVRRRMAQLYLRRAKHRLAGELAAEDYLAQLQLSRLQYERLYELTMQEFELAKRQVVEMFDDPRLRNTLLRTAGNFCKRRDEVLAIAVEQRGGVRTRNRRRSRGLAATLAENPALG